ncbi:MAG: MFS transporter [Vicinamibacteria bacterium]
MTRQVPRTTTSTDQDAESPAPSWALAPLSLSMLMPSLGTSIANVSLPELARVFDASFQDVQWIVLAYLISLTSLIVSAGRLGDVVGRRRLLLMGITVFTGSSFLCGAASTLWLLVAARAAQGIGAAMMTALTLALVGETAPSAGIGAAMGLLGAMSAIGTTLGPSLGGLLIATLGWRSIFFINIPFGLVTLLLAHRHLPADRDQSEGTRAKLDLAGTATLTLTLVAYALAMTFGHGHFGWLNAAWLFAAILGVGLFLAIEQRAASPLIGQTIFRNGALGANLTTSVMVSTVMMAMLVVAPFYLSRSLHLDAPLVGLVLSVGPLVAAFTGVPAGRAVDRFGPHRMAMAGLTGMLCAVLALAVIPAVTGIAGFLVPIIVLTGSYAVFQAANNTAIMTDARPDQRGVISGMLSLSRNLGLISGASVMGAVFAAASGVTDVSAAAPAAIATGMRVTFGGAAVLITLAMGVGRRSTPTMGRYFGSVSPSTR